MPNEFYVFVFSSIGIVAFMLGWIASQLNTLIEEVKKLPH